MSQNNRLCITAQEGQFDSYIARPETESAPAIVVIQEIFGINADMRETCNQLAAEGYIAICPDLYWRQEAGVSLTDKSQEEWDKALALYRDFDIDSGVSDIGATIAAARQLSGASGKVGVVGFCLGGLLAYLCATRLTPEAAVSYYGVGIDQHLDEAESIEHGLLMHIAEQDGFVPPEIQQKIATALYGHPDIAIHTYPGCDHAFARHGGVHYDATAATLANTRSLEFFKRLLS